MTLLCSTAVFLSNSQITLKQVRSSGCIHVHAPADTHSRCCHPAALLGSCYLGAGLKHLPRLGCGSFLVSISPAPDVPLKGGLALCFPNLVPNPHLPRCPLPFVQLSLPVPQVPAGWLQQFPTREAAGFLGVWVFFVSWGRRWQWATAVPGGHEPSCQGRAMWCCLKVPGHPLTGRKGQGKMLSKSSEVLRSSPLCSKRQPMWRSSLDFRGRRRPWLALILTRLPWLQAEKLILGYKQVAWEYYLVNLLSPILLYQWMSGPERFECNCQYSIL